MKKYLAILGLLLVVSQPVFAQCSICNPCNAYLPRVQTVAVPIVQQCAPIVNPCIPCNPCTTGAACPVVTCDPCNPCMTGAASPIVNCDPCNPCNTAMQCCPKQKGFWQRFFGY